MLEYPVRGTLKNYMTNRHLHKPMNRNNSVVPTPPDDDEIFTGMVPNYTGSGFHLLLGS